MSVFHRSNEKRRIYHEFRRQEEEVIGSLCRLGSRPISPKTQLEQEKRIRREIANSNERRRMQSINAGFQSLRTLLPHHEGEKLSKAAILQHTSEFIYQLEQEKTRLLAQNCQLKRLLNHQMNQDSDGSSLDSPLPKRKKPENSQIEEVNLWKTPLGVSPEAAPESSDEGIGHMSPSSGGHHGLSQDLSSLTPGADQLQKDLVELRLQLERERNLRALLEDKARLLEAQLFPEDEEEAKQLAEQEEEEEEAALDNIKSPYGHCSPEYGLPMEKCSELFSEQRVPSPVEPLALKEEEDQLSVTMMAEEEQLEEESSEPHDLSAKGTTSGGLVATLCTLPVMLPPSPCTVVLEDTASVVVVVRPALEEFESRVSQESEGMKDLEQEEPVDGSSEFQVHGGNGPLYHASTSRQNLETIVEAIRHLEGDHLFLDDPQEEIIVQSQPQKEVLSRSAALACGGHEYAIRQQVIHCSVATRPGVIVSNHS